MSYVRWESVPVTGVDEYAIRLTVGEPRLPSTRFEVATGNRFLLTQPENVALLGVIERHYAGVDVHATGAYSSPIPPIRADEARRFPPPRTPEWHARWAHRFAGWLFDSALTPLHRGDWILRARMPARHDRHSVSAWLRHELVRDHPAAELDWFGLGWSGILPLRRLSESDAARVKAHRKLVREGTLPPVLLMWASCLDGYVLLDGHDRLIAALAEETDPPLLILHRTATADERAQQTKWALATQQKIADGVREMASRLDIMPAGPRRDLEERKIGQADARNQRYFGSTLVEIESDRKRTAAWPHPGGTAHWRLLAESLAPSWQSAVVREQV
ncbi:hypothetical protein GCM10009765_72560 [Fodinicola feengrottensis]|uniref:Uncharacterized protein n=1 Tax=Fodinicola feengrottensis TaxID=435914 RepID=A0ABN2IW24_9ACTN